jgi:hypothetical protein
MTPEEFDAARRELWVELERVRPRRILAVGALAAKALLGERYTEMTVCNGIGFAIDTCRHDGNLHDRSCTTTVIPTWHPAAALRPGGEDRLAYTGAAIKAFGAREVKMCPAVSVEVPPVTATIYSDDGVFGIDTEGTPEDPICMTVASRTGRQYVSREGVAKFFAGVGRMPVRFLFHNAPWDWRVLWAMGAPRDIATRWQWADTMELAYLKQTEPKGLKDLAYRHLGIRMASWEDVVMPHYHSMLRAAGEGLVAAHTTVTTHSPKTGKLLKRPKVVVAEPAKAIKRALDNPKLLAERMPGLPEPSLWLVPEAERVEYATLDAWVTVMMERHLR